MHTRRLARALALSLAVAAIIPAAASGQQPPPPQQQGGGAPRTQKPAPRVLVLTFGRADQGQMAPVVQGAAESTLQELRFPLVDESQVMASYQLDTLEKFLVLTPELARIAELKARFGVELVVVVQYSRTFQYEKEFFGAKSKYYKNDVRVKAIAPDTAEILYSGGGEGSIEARQTGLEQLAREHVRRLAEGVLERWSYEAVGPSTYQVLATGFDHPTLQRLEGALRGRQGVRDVIERDFGGIASGGAGNGLLEVKFTGTIDELKAALGAIGDPAVEIRASSTNRVEVAPARGLKVGFLAPSEGAVIGGREVKVVLEVDGRPPIQVDLNGTPGTLGESGRLEAPVPLQAGENVIRARVRDALGREGAAQVRVLCDERPPEAKIVAPKSGTLTNRRSIEVEVDARDDVGVAEVLVNGVPAKRGEDGRYRATVDLGKDGKHEVVVTARDAAGQEARTSGVVTVDSVPPRIDGNVTAVIEGKVDKAGVTLTLDGKTIPVAPDGTFRVTVEAPAGGSVTVVATDAAGNRSEKVYKIGGQGTR